MLRTIKIKEKRHPKDPIINGRSTGLTVRLTTSWPRENQMLLIQNWHHFCCALSMKGKPLIGDRFEPQDVSVRSTLRYCPSLAECILAERSLTWGTPRRPSNR